jgi:hypothetical protein
VTAPTAPPESYTGPYCLPHDDGVHFWWFHWCWYYLGPGGSRVDRVRETMLPVGGEKGWAYDPAADTVHPSILCNRCGTHGFWVNGKWRPA